MACTRLDTLKPGTIKMQIKSKTRGGARSGAGAPTVSDKAKSRTISLNDAEFAKFKLIGGLKWLKDLLNSPF